MARAPFVLEDNLYCYVCGKGNPEGLHVVFDTTPDGDFATRVTFAAHHAGGTGAVHFGHLGMVLDEIAVNMLLDRGIPNVSAEMRMREMEPVWPGEEILFRGRLVRERGPLIEVEVEALRAADPPGRLVAAGRVTCLRVVSSE